MTEDKIDLSRLACPILLRGDATTAYRDPAVVYHEGVFHLFFTLVKTEADGRVFLRLAKSRSSDLVKWSEPLALTPADAHLNYSSPGSVVRFRGQWVMCLQTYPRPNGEKYANDTARLWTMRSHDLDQWDEPRLLEVKGPHVPPERMGRMIDPFLFQDRENAEKWWCFYKQNGVSMSWSYDLENWTYFGQTDAGENSCVIADNENYLLLHSPENGIGIKRSNDLIHWQDEGVIYLAQDQWPWARGRLTAGFVLDLRRISRVGKYLLFFHGSGPEDERTFFDTHASIGIAWSDSFTHWNWPV